MADAVLVRMFVPLNQSISNGILLSRLHSTGAGYSADDILLGIGSAVAHIAILLGCFIAFWLCDHSQLV